MVGKRYAEDSKWTRGLSRRVLPSFFFCGSRRTVLLHSALIYNSLLPSQRQTDGPPSSSPLLRKRCINIHLDRPLRLQLLYPLFLLNILYPPLLEVFYLFSTSASLTTPLPFC